jgi:hypothetical protein
MNSNFTWVNSNLREILPFGLLAGFAQTGYEHH